MQTAITMQAPDDLADFYQAWSWKREHLPDRDRFKRPYSYQLDEGSEKLRIKQARFEATGFASTGEAKAQEPYPPHVAS
jgi:hypothetical protein